MLLLLWPMQRSAVIEKPSHAVKPNLLDYASARASFTWEEARRGLEGLPGGRGLNIAHEAVDRHANGALADRVALRCIAKDGSVHDLPTASSRTRRTGSRTRS